MQLHIGTTLQGGKYRITEVLGQGGFGITYLAEQPLMLSRKVAIKEYFIKKYFARDVTTTHITCPTDSTRAMAETYRRKFIKEAQLQLKMHHPNLVEVYDIFEENDTAYYVMEYIEGETLADMMKRRGALPEEEAVGYITKVAEALWYIHAQRVMHLDVKPANILVRKSDGCVKLIDFGTSKHYDSKSGEQTTTTTPCYSPGYAPSEQCQTGGVKEFSPQTDIYALGATLYHLTTGEVPPVANEILNNGLPPTPGMAPALRAAIEKSMQSKKADRPSDVLQFLSLLGASLINSEIRDGDTIPINEEEYNGVLPSQFPKSLKTPLPDKKKNRLLIISLVGGFLVCSAILLIIFSTGKSSQIRKAAEQGDEEAQYELGLCYMNGEGVTQNYAEAMKWFRMAAEQGDAEAQYNLGVCYDNGWGSTEDDTEAVKWYRKAAEQGDADAQNRLGECYYNGWGVTPDNAEAMKWFRMAAEQDDAVGQYNLALCYDHGWGVKEDDTEAMKWYRKAAEQGHADAQNNLGVCYDNGWGVTTDNAEAMKWFRKAAEQGHADAQYNLALCYDHGWGVKEDDTEAMKWYRKAAEQGHADAQNNLGMCYDNGWGSTEDDTEAVKWYRKAAEQGDADAQYNLGLCYKYGEGVTQDEAEAMKWFRKAAEQGHGRASQKLLDLAKKS